MSFQKPSWLHVTRLRQIVLFFLLLAHEYSQQNPRRDPSLFNKLLIVILHLIDIRVTFIKMHMNKSNVRLWH